MFSNVLHYLLVTMAVVYVLLFLAFGLWVYRSTQTFHLSASLSLYEQLKQHNTLTPGQERWLDYLATVGNLILVCAILILIFELPILADDVLGESLDIDRCSDYRFQGEYADLDCRPQPT